MDAVLIFQLIGILGVTCAGLIALFLPLILALTVSPVWLWSYLIYVLIILIMACMYAAHEADNVKNQRGGDDDGNDET